MPISKVKSYSGDNIKKIEDWINGYLELNLNERLINTSITIAHGIFYVLVTFEQRMYEERL